MRLRYVAWLSFVLFLLPVGVAAAKGGVAVVDFTRLIEESQAGLQGRAHIESVAANMQEQLMAVQESGDMGRMQMAYSLYQQATNILQEQVVVVFTNLVGSAAEEVRKAKGLDSILSREAVLAFAPEADVTDLLIAEMDKKTITYPTPEFDLEVLLPPLATDEAEASAPEAGKAQ